MKMKEIGMRVDARPWRPPGAANDFCNVYVY